MNASATVTLLLNFEAADLTLRCLERLLEASPDGHRVLVMDNGSGAEQEAALRSGVAAHPNVELILHGENLGYCAAMNRGIAWAAERSAEFVLFLNNDVQVEDGLVESLSAVLANDPSLAAVAPTIVRPDGQVWCQGAEIGFSQNINWLRGEGTRPAPRDTGPQTVGYLPGACALYRLADLESVRGLDEAYFMYFEDALLGQRLRDGGRKLLWLPWVRVVHDPSTSSGGGRSPLRKYMTACNTVRFLRRRFSFKLWAAFFLLDCLALPLAYLYGARAGWAKTVGIFDGLRGHRVTAADVARWRPTIS